MTDALARWNTWLNGYVWGPPMIVLLVGTGIVLTILTGGVQFRRLGTVFMDVLGRNRSRGDGTVTPFQAVATALASTVGNRQHRWRRNRCRAGRAGRASVALGFRVVWNVHEVRGDRHRAALPRT